MSRYIDAQYLFKCETCRHCIGEYKCDTFCDSGECYSPNMVKIPTADVVEVRHGEWIVDNRTFSVMDKFGYVREEHKKTHTCSECRVGIVGLANMKYCPNCGAKMDGERREG